MMKEAKLCGVRRQSYAVMKEAGSMASLADHARASTPWMWAVMAAQKAARSLMAAKVR